MTTLLLQILAATLIAGVLSVLAAASVPITRLARVVPQMIGLSAGLLLGTSALHLLPEAFSSGVDPHRLGWVMLAGLVGFFALEKFAILRHAHHHEGDGHAHSRGHDRREAGPGGVTILIGDSIHNFADGVLIAAAFLADPRLGWIAALSLAAHEIPQELGDFIVLHNAGFTRARALVYNALSGCASVIGGVVGYLSLSHGIALLPYVLVVSAASFIYVSLADLIPDMHRHGRGRDAAIQLGLMMLGIALIALLSAGADHAH